MTFRADTYNQALIDKYFKAWIGISVSLPLAPETDPLIFYLDFNSHCNAAHAYTFLGKWQNFNGEKQLRLSLIEETDGTLSCYFFTPGFSGLKRGRFKLHFPPERLTGFVALQKAQPDFKVVVRYADKNYDVQDFEKQDVPIILNALSYRKRESVKKGQMEFE